MEKIVKTEDLSKLEAPVCGFGCLRPRVKNDTKYDEYYVNKEVKEYIEKTGESEFDFIIKKKVVETKEPIKEVVNCQADQVGIEAYMRSVMAEGINPQDMVATVSEEINDFTNAPETLADGIDIAKIARKKFDALPEEVKGKCGTYEEFASTFTDKMFDDYIKSLIAKKEDKPNGGYENG